VSADADDDASSMTVAFALGAAERLAAPEEAFADAESWVETRAIGVVSERPRAAERFVSDNGLRQDLFPGDRGLGASLALARRQYATDRYVLVGTGEHHRRAAESAGWEYLPVEEAAGRAEWALDDPDSDTDADTERGLLGRLRALFGLPPGQ
jgi:hypothetical protein